jgi:hypothetical protein
MDELDEREDQHEHDVDNNEHNKSNNSNNVEALSESDAKKTKQKKKFYWKNRYPPTVKKLSVLCSDVLAKCVRLT